jgi:hypothetical protein
MKTTNSYIYSRFRRGLKLTTHLHLVPRSKNVWIYTSTPQYASMGWCSLKAQGQLYLFQFNFMFHLQYLRWSCTWGFPTKILYTFLICLYMTSHYILLDLMTWFIFGEEYETSSLGNLLQSSVTSPVSGTNIIVSTQKLWNKSLHRFCIIQRTILLIIELYGFHWQAHKVQGCNQKFPDWPPETRTANVTALCH